MDFDKISGHHLSNCCIHIRTRYFTHRSSTIPMKYLFWKTFSRFFYPGYILWDEGSSSGIFQDLITKLLFEKSSELILGFYILLYWRVLLLQNYVNLHLLSHKYVLNYNSIILKRINDSFNSIQHGRSNKALQKKTNFCSSSKWEELNIKHQS